MQTSAFFTWKTFEVDIAIVEECDINLKNFQNISNAVIRDYGINVKEISILQSVTTILLFMHYFDFQSILIIFFK